MHTIRNCVERALNKSLTFKLASVINEFALDPPKLYGRVN